MNRGSANPINQNILKLGRRAFGRFFTLLFFDFTLLINSRRERKERFKEFSRERSRLRGGCRESRDPESEQLAFEGCRNYLIPKDIAVSPARANAGIPRSSLCITKEPQEISIPVERASLWVWPASRRWRGSCSALLFSY